MFVYWLLLKSEDSYGYKIIKDMKPYIQMSESTLYTILKRLELADMLTVRTAEYGGRLRKYYHITDVGLKRIEDFKRRVERNYVHISICKPRRMMTMSKQEFLDELRKGLSQLTAKRPRRTTDILQRK